MRQRITIWLLLYIILGLSIGTAFAEELTLLNALGEPVAYIDTEDVTIYLWAGQPVAYLTDASGEALSIHSFPGEHLGWLQDGVIWSHSGYAVGFLEGALDIPKQIEPRKGLKQLKPRRGLRGLAPPRPAFNYQWSTGETLTGLLSNPPSTSAAPAPRSPATSVYSSVGLRHWIRSVQDGGRAITLEDGSMWEVYGLDRIDSMLWLPVTNIEVELARSPIGDYRYMLINTDDDEAVLAKYLGSKYLGR